MTAPSPTVESAISRAAAYALFANTFAYPDDERLLTLHEAAGEVLEMGGWIPLMRLAAVAREAERQSLEPVYVSATTFSSSPDCPAFETAYFGSDAQQQTHRMADIAGFYRAFGVDATSGGYRPDELAVELEFMAYLCRKEAYAIEHLGAPRSGQARRAQRMFLQQHLGRWARVFARKLEAATPLGHFYSVAALTLEQWLTAELVRTGAAPEEVPDDIRSAVPLPVSHGPEFAGNASFVPMEELAVR